MNSFSDALREKISLLQDEKEELEDSLSRTSGKLEILQELLDEEEGKLATREEPSAPRRKSGRPRGSKKKPPPPPPATGEFFFGEEAEMGGTDPTLADAIRRRTSIAPPRHPQSYGPGVHVGAGRPSPGPRPSPASHVSVEDE